jgi:hypothetical protein
VGAVCYSRSSPNPPRSACMGLEVGSTRSSSAWEPLCTPQNQLQNLLICTFHTLRFPTYTYRHIQTHTDTYIYIYTLIQTHTCNIDMIQTYTASLSLSLSHKVQVASMYQVTHGATATAREWPGTFPNPNLENVY